ncbi:hypothetical protein PM082_013810 [Marasmius tenuissimus]|nr:hypothetical protein PM082_013810 [Marasmius tenuissimus]
MQQHSAHRPAALISFEFLASALQGSQEDTSGAIFSSITGGEPPQTKKRPFVEGVQIYKIMALAKQKQMALNGHGCTASDLDVSLGIATVS